MSGRCVVVIPMAWLLGSVMVVPAYCCGCLLWLYLRIAVVVCYGCTCVLQWLSVMVVPAYYSGCLLWLYLRITVVVCYGCTCVLQWLSVMVPFPCDVCNMEVRRDDGGWRYVWARNPRAMWWYIVRWWYAAQPDNWWTRLGSTWSDVSLQYECVLTRDEFHLDGHN
jgi:hypothetical protein